MSKTKRKKPGPKPHVFTRKEIEIAEDAAFQGCKDFTIAGLLDMRVETLKANVELCRRLRQKRQERDRELRRAQTKMAAHNVAMAIFLGKNELGQSDKQDVSLTGKDGQPLPPFLVEVKNVPMDENDSK